MSVWAWGWLICGAATPVEVTVTPLRGPEATGSLIRLSDQGVEIRTSDGTQPFESTVLQSAQISPAPVIPSIADGPSAVALVDGSLLAVASYVAEKGMATISLAVGANIEVPTSQISWVRFGKQDATLQKQWEELAARASSADRIVVRNVGNAAADGGAAAVAVALDELEGALSDVRLDTIDFVFDGSPLKVQRKKVEGVVYFHPPAKAPTVNCRLVDSSGSIWCLRSLQLAGESLKLVTAGGVECALSASQWSKVDYSAGNLVFLSDLQPESVQSRLQNDLPAISASLSTWFQPRFNRSVYGGPLMLGGQPCDRGLVLHSQTKLTYRLSDDFQRFLATVGIDDRFRSNGGVRLVISGEKGPLFEKTIQGHDEPLDLDVDIRGARRLQILVDYGDDRSEDGDHLNLCNARLVK